MPHGSSHLRYDHSHRPAIFHVLCPRCGGRASATVGSPVPSERVASIKRALRISGRLFVPGWAVKCETCARRAEGVLYDELPPLYYRAHARGRQIWGWNREHFVLLLHVLERQDVSRETYAWYRTYVRREWLRGSARLALARAMRRFLATHA